MTRYDTTESRYYIEGLDERTWRTGFWDPATQEILDKVAEGELLGTNSKLQTMVCDARSMIEGECTNGSALALLCFSEACGILYTVSVLKETRPSPKEAFTTFLHDCMNYKGLNPIKLYEDARCGLAHSFFMQVEKRQLIVTVDAECDHFDSNGVEMMFGRSGTGAWVFSCKHYFSRFLEGVLRLDEALASALPAEKMENLQQ